MNRATAQAKHAAPKVVIIVLNWNGRALTADCLDSLQKVTYPNFEVILVDNGSADGSVKYFREHYSKVRLIETGKNLGFAGGSNVGIRHALASGTDYILLLNNDTVVDAAFLDELVSAAESRADVGILNPKIYYFEPHNMIWYAGGELSLYRGFSRHRGFKQIDIGQYEVPGEISFITGCAFFIKRAVIEKIGMLDEKFFCYSEDADWSIRARRAGYNAYYVPSSKIWHKEGASTNRQFSIYMGTRNVMYLVWKHAPIYQFVVFLSGFFFIWMVKAIVKAALTGQFRLIGAMFKGVAAFVFMSLERKDENGQ